MKKNTLIKIKNIKEENIIDIDSTDIESNISIPVLTNNIKKSVKNNIKANSNKANSNKIQINKISESIYDRPELTYTDKLSKLQIQDLLVDYEQIKNVDELNNIQPGTHLRYFQMVNSKLKFRTGGILTVKSGLPAYIILSSGKVSWSVQVSDCIFFRRITIKEVKLEYIKILEDKQREIDSLKNLIKTQSNEITRLKKNT